MPTTGDRIREVREHRKMTQDKLAELSGISKGFLSDVENNNRNVSSENLLRIATALGASADYLLTGEVRTGALVQEPLVIPPELSLAAEQLNLSYKQTVDLLMAHRSVIARRSNEEVKPLTVEDWKSLHRTLKEVFG
jgi:transcriptional regulator with XRE-family HTH domain